MFLGEHKTLFFRCNYQKNSPRLDFKKQQLNILLLLKISD